MMVVTRAVVGLTAVGGNLEFIGPLRRPILSGETTLLLVNHQTGTTNVEDPATTEDRSSRTITD
jgi:hypothetical protein